MDHLASLIFVGLLSAALGVGATFYLSRVLRRQARTQVVSHAIAERIRAVGKLVGLEVLSKEIVTQTRGLSWLPPLLLSQARLAMIFCFEKQYYVDLHYLKPEQVQDLGGGRYRVTLPRIEGSLRLLDVTPYDIQSGKLLGLLDVFRMDAETQKVLMAKAQEAAHGLYDRHASRYEEEAQRAIARQVTSLLQLFDVEVEVRFAGRGDVDGRGAAFSHDGSAPFGQPTGSVARSERRRSVNVAPTFATA